MALPKLNTSPKYEMVIPSSKQTVRYRPYLVKEEKVLLMAFESNDSSQAMNAIIDTILVCIDEDVKRETLTTFDVEYMFTQIRSKSVGETSKVNVKCEKCETLNAVTINLAEVELDTPESVNNEIELTPEVSIELSYPSADSLINIDKEATNAEKILATIVASIDAIKTEEERVSSKDVTKKEIEEFVDSMTGEQFSNLAEYVKNIPTLKENVEFVCENCGHNNSRELVGFTDFF
mgnify:CR=1 FL=1|tara:strand:+ start:1374 stop:2078 length:705 start_codon:yes stop_codon:yes gene_type:complete